MPSGKPDVVRPQGTVIDGPADWRKGSTWVLQCEDGQVIRAHAVPPPDAA